MASIAIYALKIGDVIQSKISKKKFSTQVTHSIKEGTIHNLVEKNVLLCASNMQKPDISGKVTG